jgi:hypothetical protein
MIDEARLAREDRATASTRYLFIFCLSEEVCNILGKVTNCVMTTKSALCEGFIVTSCARTSNFFNTGLRLLGMLGENVIVQCLLRCCLITAILTLMFESTVVIRLVMHVHGRLLRTYKGAVRTDILTIGVFLIYVDHLGDIDSPARPLSIFRNGSLSNSSCTCANLAPIYPCISCITTSVLQIHLLLLSMKLAVYKTHLG